jgi:3-deoxy-7-phosphoheptulonate synthase
MKLETSDERGRLDPMLVSRSHRSEDTTVVVAGAQFGGRGLAFIAGPCAVENRDQLRHGAEAAAQGGARLLRGGAYKPRTSPYSFQGLGEAGLHLLREVADEFGLGVVTEVMAPEHVPLVASYADMLQVGSRNAQNFELLRAVGRAPKAVLLKRGMMSTLDEFLHAAEYVLAGGNPNVILCERGIRTFEPSLRNTFDVVAIPALKERTHLPIIADPSHATGKASLVEPAALAAVAAGAHGLLMDVHSDPEKALCDGAQALLPHEYLRLVDRCRALHRALMSEA